MKIVYSAVRTGALNLSFNGVKRKGDEDKKGVKEKQQCANNEDTKVIITFLCHHTVGPVAQSV